MRGSVLGSSLVHLALLVVLLAVRTAAPIVIPGPDVVQVALVDAPNAAIIAPPPAPKPKLEAAEVAPTDEQGIKLEPPKKKKPEKKKEEEEPVPVPPTPAAALPYATVGNAGLRGQISLDVHDFEFTYYLILVRNRIAQSWAPPAGLAAVKSPHALVYFRIGRDGSLSNIRLEEASGIEFFDRSAVRAVTLSNPLPPLPLGYTGGGLVVHFGFEYAGP